MKKIYYLCSCDEWKSYNGMNLLFIGSSIRKLKMYIANKIKNGDMEYTKNGDENESVSKQIKNFKDDFNNEDINYINDFLKYGFIGETYNNEPI